MAGEILLVVGLGNPGDRYAGTRHNVGFLAVERFVAELGGSWESPAIGKGLVAQMELSGRRLWAAEPHTYMNASGEMVAPLARFYKIEPPSVLVVSDDFNLPLGRLRIRAKGSAGGQKGLESILQQFGTQELPRVRLGVGPVSGRDPADFVLARFRSEEREAASAMIVRAVEAVEVLCERGLEAAMNAFNGESA